MIYTDGSAYKNTDNGFQTGSAVIFNNDDIIRFKPSPLENENNTSVYAEYAAIEKAIHIAIQRDYSYVEIRTDCFIMASALTDWHGLPKWVSNWQKNATDDGIWMNNRKLIVPHQQIFKNILQMKSKIKVDFTYVKSHGKDKGNAMADIHAKKAAQRDI